MASREWKAHQHQLTTLPPQLVCPNPTTHNCKYGGRGTGARKGARKLARQVLKWSLCSTCRGQLDSILWEYWKVASRNSHFGVTLRLKNFCTVAPGPIYYHSWQKPFKAVALSPPKTWGRGAHPKMQRPCHSQAASAPQIRTFVRHPGYRPLPFLFTPVLFF